MLDSDKTEFVKYFSEMSSLYPTAPADATRPHAYFRHLKDFSLESVKTALRKASGQSQEFLPTAPKIREIAEAEDKAAHARRNDPPRAPATHQLGEARWIGVPKSFEAQKAYVSEANSPGEQLARIWECESVRRGDRPNNEIPRDEGLKRMKQFQQLIDKIGSAKNYKSIRGEDGAWMKVAI